MIWSGINSILQQTWSEAFSKLNKLRERCTTSTFTLHTLQVSSYFRLKDIINDPREPGDRLDMEALSGLTFSWLKESILFMAVSKAVMDSRKVWSCSHSGLLSRSVEIFTAALDMAETHSWLLHGWKRTNTSVTHEKPSKSPQFEMEK